MTTPATPPTPPSTPPTPAPAAAIAQVETDAASDVTATKAAVQTVAGQARVEYDALSNAAKARIHTLLNDVESMFSVSLANMHTLFGAGSGSGTGGVTPTPPTPAPTPSSPAVKAAATHPPALQDKK